MVDRMGRRISCIPLNVYKINLTGACRDVV
jgi:hypothetical protein